jgi:drug/metabolite transporter (DMT)-like permease
MHHPRPPTLLSEMRLHLDRCLFFWLWALTGGMLALSAVSYLGVLTGIPALVALFLVARRSPTWPEPLGLLAGVGGLCLAISAFNWDDRGVDVAPWLAAGSLLALVGLVGYGMARRNLQRQRKAPRHG